MYLTLIFSIVAFVSVFSVSGERNLKDCVLERQACPRVLELEHHAWTDSVPLYNLPLMKPRQWIVKYASARTRLLNLQEIASSKHIPYLTRVWQQASWIIAFGGRRMA